MKTIGIAMLFGLCTLIGIRAAAEKTTRLKTVSELKEQLRMFSERIAGGCSALKNSVQEPGTLQRMLSAYLEALNNGRSESEAVACAAELLPKGSAERTGAKAFFSGLSFASRSDILKRIELYAESLGRAEREAYDGAGQARVIRISGALIGAGLAILLL